MSFGTVKVDTIQSSNNTITTDDFYQMMNSRPTVATNTSFKNRLINGDMNIWQRGTSFTANGYGADRWQLYAGSGMICAQSTDVPNSNFLYSLSISGTGVPQITQNIESANIRDLVGKNITLSFWAKTTSGSGNISAVIRYPGGLDNFTTFTDISNNAVGSSSTSWTYYTITFTNLPATIANGLQIVLYLNTSSAGTILFTGVQLEEGSVATNFEFLPYNLKLSLCQRYYYTYMYVKSNIWLTYTPNGDTRGWVLHPVKMRTGPSISFSNTTQTSIGFGQSGTLVNINTVISPAYISDTAWGINTDTAYSSYGGVVVWGSFTNTYIYANAEL